MLVLLFWSRGNAQTQHCEWCLHPFASDLPSSARQLGKTCNKSSKKQAENSPRYRPGLPEAVCWRTRQARHARIRASMGTYTRFHGSGSKNDNCGRFIPCPGEARAGTARISLAGSSACSCSVHMQAWGSAAFSTTCTTRRPLISEFEGIPPPESPSYPSRASHFVRAFYTTLPSAVAHSHSPLLLLRAAHNCCDCNIPRPK